MTMKLFATRCSRSLHLCLLISPIWSWLIVIARWEQLHLLLCGPVLQTVLHKGGYCGIRCYPGWLSGITVDSYAPTFLPIPPLPQHPSPPTFTLWHDILNFDLTPRTQGTWLNFNSSQCFKASCLDLRNWRLMSAAIPAISSISGVLRIFDLHTFINLISGSSQIQSNFWTWHPDKWRRVMFPPPPSMTKEFSGTRPSRKVFLF